MRQRQPRSSAAADVDSSKANVNAAQHALDEAMAELNVQKARLATAMVQRRQSQETQPRQEELTQARFKASEAMVRQSQASLNQAQLNLGYTTIVAPVSGVVSRKVAEPGMQVSTGQQVMVLVPLDDVWVTANFKENTVEEDGTGSESRIRRRYLLAAVAPITGMWIASPPLPAQNLVCFRRRTLPGNYVKVVQRVPVKILLDPG